MKIKNQNSSYLGTVVVRGSKNKEAEFQLPREQWLWAGVKIKKQNSSSLESVVVGGSENKQAEFQLPGNNDCGWE